MKYVSAVPSAKPTYSISISDKLKGNEEQKTVYSTYNIYFEQTFHLNNSL
ncbi:hypothetical protein AAC03nite_39680 [Alicyclobacillus acidoterrestris]|nr:hypothetical protein AAC03nite_39680 [Alicyclobacillus acidoterrestris]